MALKFDNSKNLLIFLHKLEGYLNTVDNPTEPMTKNQAREVSQIHPNTFDKYMPEMVRLGKATKIEQKGPREIRRQGNGTFGTFRWDDSYNARGTYTENGRVYFWWKDNIGRNATDTQDAGSLDDIRWKDNIGRNATLGSWTGWRY